MVDCLQSDGIPADSVFNEDGTVKTGKGCLSAVIQRCLLSDHVEYEIQLNHPRGHTWVVTRRYREFNELRKALHSNYALPDSQSIRMPAKKLFNNLSLAFVHQRGLELETFLNALLTHYTLPPPPLADFIDWERYDVHGITNCLARQLARDGDTILDSDNVFVMHVYQLNAINKRMISPVSLNLFNRPNEDFGRVLDFVSRIKRLKLLGSLDKLHKSNIAVNTLTFDMSPFRSLQFLELNNVDLRRMRGFEHIKATVAQLVVHHSLKNLKNLLLGDLFAVGDGDWVHGENPIPTLPWDQIKIANFSSNFLHLIDQTITLLPNVEILNLSNNLLTEIAPLTSLPLLRVLYLADNQLYIGEESTFVHNEGCEQLPPDATDLPEGLVLSKASVSAETSESSTERWKRPVPLKPLRERLGEVQVLVLANNGLRSTSIVDGIYSLQHLDLSGNKIDSFAELTYLGNLPHLNSLELIGNPICDHPYYRRNVLDLLGPRFSLIVLDGQRVTTSERENVRLYQALKKGGAVIECVSPATALGGRKSNALVDKRPSPLCSQVEECTNATSDPVIEDPLLYSPSQPSHQNSEVVRSHVGSWSDNTPSNTAIVGNRESLHAPESVFQDGSDSYNKLQLTNLECIKHRDSDGLTALEEIPTAPPPSNSNIEQPSPEVSGSTTEPETTQLDVLRESAEGGSYVEHHLSDVVDNGALASALVTSTMAEKQLEFHCAPHTPPVTKHDNVLGEPLFAQSNKPEINNNDELPTNSVKTTLDESPGEPSSVTCHVKEEIRNYRRETAITDDSIDSHVDTPGVSSAHLKTPCDIQDYSDPGVSSGLLLQPEATGGEDFPTKSVQHRDDAQEVACLSIAEGEACANLTCAIVEPIELASEPHQPQDPDIL